MRGALSRALSWAPLAVAYKDVVLEVRSKDTVVAVAVFALLTIVVFNFALDPTPQSVGLLAPGILWISFTFGGVVGMTRAFAVERERGGMQGLLLTPAGRDEMVYVSGAGPPMAAGSSSEVIAVPSVYVWLAIAASVAKARAEGASIVMKKVNERVFPPSSTTV